MSDLLLENERKQVIEYGKKLINQDLTTGTGGNISVYNPEKELMAISPSGIDYFQIEVEDVVIMDLNGNIVEGDNKPSSEYEMHRIFYDKRDDVNAVVHTHSMYATTISCTRKNLPAVHYMIAVAGIEVPCAKYATFGSDKLAKNAYQSMGQEKNATLLANHGLVAVGESLSEAFNVAREIEYVSEIYYRTQSMGDSKILPENEMKHVLEKFKTYGQ